MCKSFLEPRVKELNVLEITRCRLGHGLPTRRSYIVDLRHGASFSGSDCGAARMTFRPENHNHNMRGCSPSIQNNGHALDVAANRKLRPNLPPVIGASTVNVVAREAWAD